MGGYLNSYVWVDSEAVVSILLLRRGIHMKDRLKVPVEEYTSYSPVFAQPSTPLAEVHLLWFGFYF